MNKPVDLFKEDDIGRTPLFYAVASGNIQDVENIIFKLAGTGIGCQRLSLISHKDQTGITAAELARKLGCEEIRQLLSRELVRMEYYE